MKKCLAALALCAACILPNSASAKVWGGNELFEQGNVDGTNMCALTFDDGPAGYTHRLLDVLEAEGIKATFFMLGSQVRANPDAVRRVAASGHDIGIHSDTHPNMKRLGIDAQAKELIRPVLALQEFGICPRFFRPPYGNMNDSLKELAGYLGLSVIIWSHDSKDWKRNYKVDYANMESSGGPNLPDGEMRGVFLFHDTSARTAHDLPEIIRILRARGCQRFVTMTEYTAQTQRPMPNGENKELFTQAGNTLLRSLESFADGPYAASAAYLKDSVTAVAQGKPVPEPSAAGLHLTPLSGDAVLALRAPNKAPDPRTGMPKAPVIPFEPAEELVALADIIEQPSAEADAADAAETASDAEAPAPFLLASPVLRPARPGK